MTSSYLFGGAEISEPEHPQALLEGATQLFQRVIISKQVGALPYALFIRNKDGGMGFAHAVYYLSEKVGFNHTAEGVVKRGLVFLDLGGRVAGSAPVDVGQ